MSPEKQRIAIAEACGWEEIHKQPFTDNLHCHYEILFGYPRIDGGLCHEAESLPDYLTDLNAMHEAVTSLPNEMQWAWFAALAVIVPAHGPAALGNAEQWAKAFLRTLGKWEDGK